MGSETITIAALGRPLHLGMLYDCRDDTFPSGVLLWNQDAIKKNVNVRLQPKTDVNITSSDSLEERSKLLDVGASLKLSLIAGFLEVEGSASYLNHRASSMRECRATIQYSVRTKFEQLSMSEMGNVTYPEVFQQSNATHVVTGVLYGAEALMVFSQTVSDMTQKQEKQASMSTAIKGLPQIGVGAEGHVKLTDKQKEAVQNFECKFFGDFQLKKNPSTFEEAVTVFKELPELLRENKDRVVPMKVYLYPLSDLSDTAPKLVQQISTSFCTKLDGVMDSLQSARMRINDLIEDCNTLKATGIIDKLEKFERKLEEYTEVLQQQLQQLLPAIKGGIQQEEKLEDLLKFHKESSFSHSKMENWLDDKEHEIVQIRMYIKNLQSGAKSPEIVPPGQLQFDPKYTKMYVFAFNSLADEDPYLSNLSQCLNDKEFKKMENISLAQEKSFEEKTQPWNRTPKIAETMKHLSDKFKDIVKSKTTCKIISYMPYPYDACVSIRAYKNGAVQYVNYDNKSQPEVTDVRKNSLTLRLSSDQWKQLKTCIVAYEEVTESEKKGSGSQDWPTGQEELTISELQVDTVYKVWIEKDKGKKVSDRIEIHTKGESC